ncbi:MAG: peptidyl-prolyl cis-trans isomerase [Deltaproteobacteria bacterium]|nr:peptidyl-prolyl cis-trans isomerase [Deltaproteobacteria bacterium]
MSRSVLCPAAALLLALAFSCGRAKPEEDRPSRARAPAKGVLATVNGAPITEADVRLLARAGGHGAGGGEEEGEERPPEPPPEQKRQILETIIRDELVAQRAVELHLDTDQAFRDEVAARQAELDAFRRRRLVDLFYRRQREEANVTEADARRYFDANSARLKKQVHVWQILVRSEARIEEVRRELDAGTGFEDVARGQFPALPEGRRPWDLGFLRWNQIPDPWRPVLDHLAKGRTSGVIRGPRNRFWIIKLIDEREDPDVTFETWRANIIETLRAERIESRRAQTARELRTKARVVYVAAKKNHQD